MIIMIRFLGQYLPVLSSINLPALMTLLLYSRRYHKDDPTTVHLVHGHRLPTNATQALAQLQLRVRSTFGLKA